MALYSTRPHQGRHYAMFENRALGAAVHTHVRAYVFPFCTPNGVTVLQECPPDHMHHQGIMVGQDLVNGHNFWAMLHPNYPLNLQAFQHGNKVESGVEEDGVTFTMNLCWKTASGQAVLDEVRRIHFEAWDDFNFVEVTSTWKAEYGAVFLGRTKEGGLGMRLHPQLETEWGGVVRSQTGLVGAEKIFDTESDWIEVSGRVAGQKVGIVMMPHASVGRIPWFTRDYGLHLYGPMRHGSKQLAAGETFVLRVAFAAYDGDSQDGSMAAEAWAQYQRRT